MSVVTSTPEFVGREAAFATVAEALDRPPVLATVEGEAGIGKTRFVQEVLAARPNCVVLMAVCPPLREPFPLGPVVEGLSHLWQQGDQVTLSPLGGALRPLFPEWADRLPVALEALDDPRETGHRLFRALTELIDVLRVEILVVEDAHWADTATLEWLLTLVSRGPTSDNSARSIVLTFRPEEVPDGSPLWRLTSRRLPSYEVVRLELVPLDITATRRLVASMLGADEVSERFTSFLHEHTDGLPLAVEECVRLLQDRHDIVKRDGRWSRRLLDELEVPPTLRDSVIERVERLDPETRAVLQAAAILAEPAEETLLTAVADLAEEAGRRGVAGGLAAGLLREVRSPDDGGRWAFRHVLDARAVADTIPASEKSRLHSRAAQQLQAMNPQPVVRLAKHFREAGDNDAWCRYAELSADLAWQSGDDRTAVITLLDLLDSVDHPSERRVRLALKLGEVADFGVETVGEFEAEVIDALRSVLSRDDLCPADRGELRVQLGRLLHTGLQAAEAYREIELAIPDLDDRPDLAYRAMAVLATPFMPGWMVSRHLSWLKRATDLVPQLESPLARPWHAMVRATALLALGEESGWQAATELPAIASNRLEQRLLVIGRFNIGQAAMLWGRYETARRWLGEALDLIETADLTRYADSVRVSVAYVDWYTGAWNGLAETASALKDREGAERSARVEAAQLEGLLALAQGRRDTAERTLRGAASEYERLGSVEPISTLSQAALGRVLISDDRPEDALSRTAMVVDVIRQKGTWFWATDIAPIHVDALLGGGQVEEAESFVVDFAAGVRDRNMPAAFACGLLCQAILADHAGARAEAADQYLRAAAAWADLPRPYDELLTLERQGHCLLNSGNEDRGLKQLSDVQERLRLLGAKWDADRVAHVLRRHGVEVARPWRGGRRSYGNELSPRELEVVALVARGMSNPQVASELFLSPKTVERHVRSAMRKLEVSSRTALAMAAADAGLLGSDG